MKIRMIEKEFKIGAMNTFNRIVKFLKRPAGKTVNKADDGSCAMGWGYQTYDKKIRIILEDKQIDVNNHLFKYMRIQKLLKEKIEGFRLKKGKIAECPTCSGEMTKM